MGGGGGKILSALGPLMGAFGGGGDEGGAPPPPQFIPPAPTVDTGAVQEAKKREQAARLKATGFGSLNQSNNTLGVGSEDPNTVKKPTLLGG